MEPTLFIAVPRVWEKIHEGMVESGKANKGFKKVIVDWAKEVGRHYNAKRLNNEYIGITDYMQYQLANVLVFQKIRDALGLSKCLRNFTSAAPLSKDIIEYFMDLDLRIMEIYGMSEVCGPQLTNTLELQRMGTLGHTLEGFNSMLRGLDGKVAKVGSQGEICAKGRNVMMGYKGMPEKTRAALDKNGWLKSGDLGQEDEEGFISITGRIKEILVTAGGENVAPVPLEEALYKHLAPFVTHAVAVGDRRKFVSCLLSPKTTIDPQTGLPTDVLDAAALEWIKENAEGASTSITTAKEASTDDAVKKAIQKAIDLANEEAATSRAALVRAWRVAPRAFSLPGGELGPTLKVKRRVVYANHAALLDDIYSA